LDIKWLCRKCHRTADGFIGEGARHAKLTDAQVHEIKKLLHDVGMSVSVIARKFGVGQTTIRSIRNGRTWTHL
jgi:hypothetical protein